MMDQRMQLQPSHAKSWMGRGSKRDCSKIFQIVARAPRSARDYLRREKRGRVFNLLVRVATGLPFWDTQCGFKAFQLDVCRPILEAAHVNGFAFDVELLFLANRAGLRVREIPVRWNHAEGSKVSFFRDSLRMLREVIALRARA